MAFIPNDGWMDGWMDWLTDWLTDWLSEWVSEWANERVSEWVGGWMNGSFIKSFIYWFIDDYRLTAALCGDQFQSCVGGPGPLDFLPILNESATIPEREALFNTFCGWVRHFTEDFTITGNIQIYSHFMMTSSNGNIFRVTGLLCGEFTGHRWIPHIKGSDAGLWCFLWFAPEWMVE